MKSKTIAELLNKEEVPDQFPVMAVEGVLEKLFKHNSGTGQYGDWELQNGSLKDSTGEIKIVFSNNTQHLTSRGRKVKMMSTKSEHGWKGVVIDDIPEKNVKGKVYPAERVLKVTAVAEIVYEGGQAAQQSGQSGQSNQTQQSTSYPQQKPSEIIKDVLACHDSVFVLVNDHYKDQTPEFRQSFIASVFIEANKQGACQQFIKRESQKVESSNEKVEKPVDQNNLFPADWPEAIVPGGSQKGKKLKDVEDESLLSLFSYYDVKGDNSPFAECVYQAVRDRKLAPSKTEEDDIP